MNIENANRIVVKVGTSSLTHSTGMLNLRKVTALVNVLADLHNMGKELILVSSGAVGIGTPKLALKSRPTCMKERQAAAAIGQSELMNIYKTYFSQYGKNVAQLLLTKIVLDVEEMKNNTINTLDVLLEHGIIPIINENDAISTYELEFGDNDTLSAYVATLCNADLLIIMTDIDGLYNKNPQAYPDAQRIPVVEKIDDEIRQMAGSEGSAFGTGGMKTKIMAAEIATQTCDMLIINGSNPVILYDIFDGKQPGTLFKKQ
ncbi:MAG: glutamate 5-kinase [Eubacteriales bacterium]|nr:glutamate 5-kinase [Eubacteriales bacterium]